MAVTLLAYSGMTGDVWRVAEAVLALLCLPSACSSARARSALGGVGNLNTRGRETCSFSAVYDAVKIWWTAPSKTTGMKISVHY